MAFDPVPLAIGQGAVHSDEVFRILASAATHDSQGVILPGQMKVVALGTPGAAVTIQPGAVVVRNHAGYGESYVGRAPSATQVPIAANNTGSVRRDLIIARVIDPDFSPWQPSGSPGAPNTSIPNGPYFEPHVISGVPSGTVRASQVVNYSAVELARVDVPANTSAVTNAHIVDLRSLVSPRTANVYDLVAPSGDLVLATNETNWTDWPIASIQVPVPRWATHAQAIIRGAMMGFGAGSGNGNGSADAHMRALLNGVAPTTFTPVDHNAHAQQAVTDGLIIPWSVYGEFVVTAMQDQVVTLKPQARRVLETLTTGRLETNPAFTVEFDVRFSERVV